MSRRDRGGAGTDDTIERLQHFNAGREPERLALKYRRMRLNPFVFLRGACHLFYDRLPVDRLFRKAPPAWACGDLHLENFGSYQADNRLVHFDINDFDEAALAPLTWDPLRFATSVLLAAETLHVKPDEARALATAFVDAYGTALGRGKARWVERETAEGPVRTLLDLLQGRLRPRFLDSRSVKKGRERRLRVDGKKALPADARQHAEVTALIERFAADQPDPAFFEVLDVARRIAGTGSLGVERYAVLVRGKGSPEHNLLLDLKAAQPSSLLPALALRTSLRQPKWVNEAERIVALQQRLQAVAMAFLHPLKAKGRWFVLRELQPSEDRVTLDGRLHSPAELRSVLHTMGACLAWAQLRSSGRQGSAIADELIDFGLRRKWRAPLIDAALDAAARTRADFRQFATAYDDGAFGTAARPV